MSFARGGRGRQSRERSESLGREIKALKKRLFLSLLALLVCVSFCSCSFTFSLESILSRIKNYINGDEEETRPADFVGSAKNDTFEYDLYETYAVITKYNGAATYVTVPSTLEGKPVTKIGGLAFYYGVKIVYLHLPETVTELEENALYYCDELETLILPSGLKTIGEKCFSWCARLQVIALPAGITELPHFCFNECTSLTDLFLPEGLTSVGNRAFSGCASLTSLSFGESLQSVGSYAFRGAKNLRDVTLPGGCTLGADAFLDCSEELTVHTPAGSVCDLACLEQHVRTDNHDGGDVGLVSEAEVSEESPAEAG